MCGIAGIYNYSAEIAVDEAALRLMSATVKHRGPDEEGIHIDSTRRIGLAHRRLSIIDLSTGQQPMSDPDKQTYIVFNGEIYNFRQLRTELEARGYRFNTTSDTEVILQLYRAYGEMAFRRLNGIFAFALYDIAKRKLILARDHYGVKPLYYAIYAGRIVFGSELKAILAEPSFNKSIDLSALNTFMTFRYNPSPSTLFKGILKLRPGHMLTVSSGKAPEIQPFWEPKPCIQSRITETEAIEEYRRLLQSAIKRQMVSDVPIGLLLSGGIDSAVVGYHMCHFADQKIKTFTVGFPGQGEYNELDDARITAERFGCEHYDLTLTAEQYLDFLPRSFMFTEEPIAETTIPALYYVAQLAAKHVKVVLTGQGADEPLAGYHRYIGEKFISAWSPVLRYMPLAAVAALLPRNERIKRAAFASQFADEAKRFLAIYTIFTPDMKRHLLTDVSKKQIVSDEQSIIDYIYRQSEHLEDTLSKLLFIDTRLSLPDDLLLFNDKMTMANSLEMRVPFLDVELVTFIESLPSYLKLKGFTGKYLHKKALGPWLPRDIIQRKKKGFGTPMDRWLRGSLANWVAALVDAPDSASRAYFNIDYIHEMLHRHQSRRENYNRHIFALLSFELWHKAFFGKESAREQLFADLMQISNSGNVIPPGQKLKSRIAAQ